MLCKAYGPPESLVWDEVDPPALDPEGVRIRVRAAGVNFPDLLIIEGKYQFKPDMPFAPGAEVAGEVAEVGAGVTRFAPGDRVIGMTRWAGYAEEAVVPEARCLGLPAGMSFEIGAGFPMTYGTSYHALVQRARLQAGETLLVHGASGGVGTAARRDRRLSRCPRHRRRRQRRQAARRPGALRRGRRRQLPDRPGVEGSGEGADRRCRRRRDLRPGRRRRLRAVAALHQLGRPPAGRRLRGRHDPERAREPGAPQGLPDRRSLLGRLRASRARAEPRQLRISSSPGSRRAGCGPWCRALCPSNGRPRPCACSSAARWSARSC